MSRRERIAWILLRAYKRTLGPALLATRWISVVRAMNRLKADSSMPLNSC